jgi:hypothetical protein
MHKHLQKSWRNLVQGGVDNTGQRTLWPQRVETSFSFKTVCGPQLRLLISLNLWKPPGLGLYSASC